MAHNLPTVLLFMEGILTFSGSGTFSIFCFYYWAPRSQWGILYVYFGDFLFRSDISFFGSVSYQSCAVFNSLGPPQNMPEGIHFDPINSLLVGPFRGIKIQGTLFEFCWMVTWTFFIKKWTFWISLQNLNFQKRIMSGDTLKHSSWPNLDTLSFRLYIT